MAVFMVSGAVADYRTETKIGWEDRKDICTDDGISDVPGKKARNPIYICKDSKTGKKRKSAVHEPAQAETAAKDHDGSAE